MNNPTPTPRGSGEVIAPTSFRKHRGPLITGFPAVLDACVLANSTIRDFVLYAAYLALYRPIWSDDILQELRRTLSRFGIRPERIDYMVDQMTGAFPEACVDGYESLIAGLTNDPGDRHVLAAAIVGKAQLIVTENTRHFPGDALAPYHIETTNADDFLRDLLDIDPERMIEVLTTIANSRKMPPRTVEELLHAVEANGCKGFAADMGAALEKYYADS
jgi:PIN domain-containing protein